MSLRKQFQRRDAKKREEIRKQIKVAEDYVFRWLEKRWADELEGKEIPENFRSTMRHNPAFKQLVEKRLRGEDLAAPDLDHTPVESRAADGTPQNLMIEELAGDPRPYFCECGGEAEEPGGRCADCKKLYPEPGDDDE